MEKEHIITIFDKKSISITQVESVISATPTQVLCKTTTDNLAIVGTDLHVEKLDLIEKVLLVSGNIMETKYNQMKKPLLKRIFR